MTGARASIAFAGRMAVREARATWPRLIFFFICVAIGVAAIVVLRSVVQTVRTTLTGEARSLVGADLVVQSNRPWLPEQSTTVDRLLAGASQRTEVIETQTMAAAPGAHGAIRLVEVRAVGPGYPLYGAIELADGRAYRYDVFGGRGVLVQPALAAAFGLHVGDELRLAGQAFTIRGIVSADHVQGAGGLAFGPRVYVSVDDLRALQVLGAASHATYEVFARTDEARLPNLVETLRQALPSGGVSVRSWQTVEDRIGRNLTLAENYLSLVGLAIVVIGGIGVWSVTRVFVRQKIRSVAILKALGATSPVVLATYVLQMAGLAAAGSAFGVVVAAVAIAAIPTRVLTPIGLTSAHVTASAARQGAAVGLLVSLLFALVPLLEIRRVKPLLLLRADAMDEARQRDGRSMIVGAVVAAALVLVAVWQAGSMRAGVYVSVGLASVGATLAGGGWLLLRLVRPLARARGFSVRHATLGLSRPGNQTRVILIAVGLGSFFVLGIQAVERNLVSEFTVQVGRDAPDLVLIDVQRDQVDGVQAAAAPFVRAPARLLPLLRGRVVGVEGRRVTLATPEDVKAQGELTREFGLTYRDALEPNERVVAGAFWSGAQNASAGDEVDTEVSIAALVHDRAHVDVGDLMRFDVGGRELRARVTSIRDVTWDEAQNGGFVFVLRPSPAVERAPHTFVAFLQMTPSPSSTGNLERALATRYPNVSAIDVHDVLASVREVLDNATLGVTIVGAVTLAGGVLILIGAVAMTKFQRLYEAAVYRTLGAGTRRLVSMVTIEYLLLGGLAGTIGAMGALALSWAAARQLFDIDWQPPVVLLTAGAVLVAVLVAVVGLVASADVLVRKPLETLRGE